MLWTELQNLHMRPEDKVREIISEILKMDHRKIEVEHAHRIGKPTTSPGDRHDSGQVPEVQGQGICSGKNQELERIVHLPQRGLS